MTLYQGPTVFFFKLAITKLMGREPARTRQAMSPASDWEQLTTRHSGVFNVGAFNPEEDIDSPLWVHDSENIASTESLSSFKDDSFVSDTVLFDCHSRGHTCKKVRKQRTSILADGYLIYSYWAYCKKSGTIHIRKCRVKTLRCWTSVHQPFTALADILSIITFNFFLFLSVFLRFRIDSFRMVITS